jgi:D-inositol-3-phosphate glycosyltransferase
MHTSPLDPPGIGDSGGMNVYVTALGSGLAERGWEIEILTRRSDPDQPSSVRTASGVVVRFLDAGEHVPLLKEDLPRVTSEFSSAIARLPQFDLFHSHYWLSAVAAQPIAEMQRAPHVLSLHTVAAVKNRRRANGQAAEPQSRIEAEVIAARRSSMVITSTNAERDAVVVDYGVDPDRVTVIEPGVDTDLFHPRSAHGGAGLVGERPANARDDILVVGRIQALKGQDLAIRALSHIPVASRPRLLLVGGASGSPDSYADSLRRLATERGVGDDVVFLGAQSRTDVAELMRNAALLLVPSSSETYGLVTLEAAASGTPVLAMGVAGLLDSVVDGVTGQFVSSADEGEWAIQITRILDDRRRLAALSSTAAHFAARRNWTASVARTSDLYERLLSVSADERRIS